MKINLSFSDLVGSQYLLNISLRILNLHLFASTEFVPQIIRFLENDRKPRLQRYAASAVMEIAYGSSEDVEVLVRCDVIPKLVRLIDSKFNFMREEVIL